MSKSIKIVGRALEIFLYLALGFALGSALLAIIETPEEIEKARVTYACIELLKLGEDAPACRTYLLEAVSDVL